MGEITRLCGYLPLAIGMLASQLRHHPTWTTAQLAADLAAARDRFTLQASPTARNFSTYSARDPADGRPDPMSAGRTMIGCRRQHATVPLAASQART